VLRHYRVTVEWARRRTAVLLKIPARIAAFDAAKLNSCRFMLEPALLDATLKPAFNALEKRETIREDQALRNITPGQLSPLPFWEGDVEFHMFEIGIKTHRSAEVIGDDYTTSVGVGYVITATEGINEKRHELHYVYKGAAENYAAHNLNSGERFSQDSTQWTFVKPFDHVTNQYITLKWRDIVGFQFEKWGTNDWRIDFLAINAFSPGGWVTGLTAPENLRDVDLYFLGEEPSSQTFTWINRPGPVPAPVPVALTPEQSLTAEENHQIKKLLDHFAQNIDYYNRVMLLGTDPTTIAIQFESQPWEADTVADYVEPNPLETFGSYIAYPLAKQPTVNSTLVADLVAAIQSNDPAKHQWAIYQLPSLGH
jgi:hypothetical protein